jgi:hypothetical protein
LGWIVGSMCGGGGADMIVLIAPIGGSAGMG